MSHAMKLSEARVHPSMDRSNGGGDFPSMVTLRRWIKKGVKANDGRTVKFGAERRGGQFRVPEDAIDRFWRELKGEVVTRPKAKPGPKGMKASHRRLIEIGVMKPEGK